MIYPKIRACGISQSTPWMDLGSSCLDTYQPPDDTSRQVLQIGGCATNNFKQECLVTRSRGNGYNGHYYHEVQMFTVDSSGQIRSALAGAWEGRDIWAVGNPWTFNFVEVPGSHEGWYFQLIDASGGANQGKCLTASANSHSDIQGYPLTLQTCPTDTTNAEFLWYTRTETATCNTNLCSPNGNVHQLSQLTRTCNA